jgi:hypothetical protein
VIADLVARAISDADDAIEALAEQAALDPVQLAPYLRQLLDADIYWPQGLYRAADEDFQRQLVARIDTGTGKELYPLLLILAHTRGAYAQETVRRWQHRPPPGADRLGAGLMDLLHSCGWTADTEEVRERCAATAYELVPQQTAVEIPAQGECPWCASPLWTVLDVDTAEPTVAQALAHTSWKGRLRIVTCSECLCYGDTFAEVTPDGGAAWSPLTTRPSYLPPGEPWEPEESSTVRLVAGDRRPSPYLASAWEAGGSTLGGHPDWIQDPAFPNCAACGTVMDYLGLVAGADLDEYGEGASYLFLHAPCRLAAVVYQQS